MHAHRYSEPVPAFLVHKRVRALGGLDAVARRLGLPVRVAERLLLSERPLPAWVHDVLFEERDGVPPDPDPIAQSGQP